MIIAVSEYPQLQEQPRWLRQCLWRDGMSRRTCCCVTSRPQQGESFWTALISQKTRLGKGAEALSMYELMQKEGVEPGPHTFIALLKACSRQDLKSVKQIHADLVRRGLDTDLYVGTMLVNAYKKCGSLGNAKRVFEEMPDRDVVSWTAMILGYAQTGKGEEALKLYARMLQEGVVPDAQGYVGALKACSVVAESGERGVTDTVLVKKQCLETVRAIHKDIRKGKFQENVFVGNMLVEAYAKCASLEDARQVFETMRHRDVVSWNCMILGYSRMEKGEEALLLYRRMQQEAVAQDDRSHIGALKACIDIAGMVDRNAEDGERVKQQSLETVRAIHNDVGKAERNLFLGNTLLDAYAKCGSLQEARQVFDRMPHRDVVSWNSMVLGYSEMQKGEEALLLYTRLQQEGVAPDQRTYAAALKACIAIAESMERDGNDAAAVRKRCLRTLRDIHADAAKGTSELDIRLGTMLVDAYAKCGSLDDAREVFGKLPRKDVVSWTAMISGYSQMDKREEALQMYKLMRQQGVVPDTRAYVGALKACSTLADSGDWRDGSNNKTLRQQITLAMVEAIHADLATTATDLDVFVATMLVDAYAKCGTLDPARRVFDKMPHRDVASWNAMILAYSQTEPAEEALQLYTIMQQQGVAPNDRTYVAVLNACSSLAALDKGRQIHTQIVHSGLESSPFIAASLIEMYSKRSSMADARQVFDTMPARDIVPWNSLILGHACQGESQLVFHLFHQMQQDGIQPDGVTFVGLLLVCSHAGLVAADQDYFHAMTRDFHIAPNIQHYNCLVDLLARAGQIHKAMHILHTMPFPPDPSGWKSVLAACHKWGSVELGRRAFETLIRMDEQDAAAYILMSNIYAANGMPEQAAGVQARRWRSGARKDPGSSCWMDEAGQAHAFVAQAGMARTRERRRESHPVRAAGGQGANAPPIHDPTRQEAVGAVMPRRG